MIQLREIRISKGLTQQELADRLGVGRMAVSRWETGAKKPRLSTLARIAEALGMEPEVLWTIAAEEERKRREEQAR